MNSRDHAFGKLQSLGAGEFAHLNGSLELHLHGVEQLLREWGNRPALCLAGLYHAVYGTDAIPGQLVGLEMRSSICAVIGAEAEALAYLYGACARTPFFPRIGTSQQLLFSNRFTAADTLISQRDLQDFCELTLANELELVLASEAFRRQYGVQLSHLFQRMEGLVSPAGFAAFQKALGPA
jgi:hypothetical protein